MTVDTIGWDTAQRRTFGALTAKAWLDADFRIRYEREPRTVLAEYGLRLPDGAEPPALPPEPGTELVIELLAGSPNAIVPPPPPPPPCLLSLCFCLYSPTGKDVK
jgi:putative thiazole/oxazole-modified microcin (TOMM)-like peptide